MSPSIYEYTFIYRRFFYLENCMACVRYDRLFAYASGETTDDRTFEGR